MAVLGTFVPGGYLEQAMCGIAGYVGPRNAIQTVFDQLKRLEYRGYDSAGIAYLNGGGDIGIMKRAGKLTELGKLMDGAPQNCHQAIAHSRWATHGAPTDLNAHPHFDNFDQIAIIHNGIIENYLELRQELMHKGHSFKSETDTEVAAHVIGNNIEEGMPLEVAVREGVKKLRGAYAFVVVSKKEPGKIVAARSASPMVLGIGNGESMIASDIPALLPYTRDILILEDNRVAILTPDGIQIHDLDGNPQVLEPMHIDWDMESAEKGGYEHFMLKEIHEQPAVIRQCLAGRLGGSSDIAIENLFGDAVWHDVDRVNIIACGTAYHAGLMGKYLFEKMLRLPTDVYFSSEFRYGHPVLSPRSLAVFVSQSGETADSLAALRLCKENRIRTLGVVNVIGSSIARECDRTIFTQAGPEISVASTKAFTAQVLVLTLLALYVAQVREMPGVRVQEAVQCLNELAVTAEEVLKLEPELIKIAEHIQNAPLFFFLGRGADSILSLEAALKMKEIAYVPTQESPAGEMKHGPLALVEKGVVAIFGAAEAGLRDKLVSNIKEIQARGGEAIVVTTEDDDFTPQVADHCLKIPHTPLPYLNALLTAIPFQLLSYHVARLKGCEIDMPRNLAKSVTVE